MNLMWDYERRKKDVNHVSLWDGLGNKHHSWRAVGWTIPKAAEENDDDSDQTATMLESLLLLLFFYHSCAKCFIGIIWFNNYVRLF